MKQSKLTHGSLFSGIGGFELGAEMAGIDTLWNCEIEKFQGEILKTKFPHAERHTDITKTTGLRYVDIISGGFPCQDISVAGKREGIKGKRSGLWSEMYRIIREVRPKYVVVENSPALVISGLEQVLCDLSQIGYNAEYGNVYQTTLLDTHTKGKDFTLLPTPTKSDYKATFANVKALTRYLNSGHQIRVSDILAQKGFLKSQRITLLEMMMGFPIGHTELGVSAMR
jgi:hypothetical protein